MNRRKLLEEQISFLEEHDPNSKELDALREKLKRSKRGRSSKAKGANYESRIRDKLNKRFPTLNFKRTPRSGAYASTSGDTSLSGDLANINSEYDFKCHLELKCHKAWSILRWFEQALGDCPQGKLPIVIAHQQQVIENNRRVKEAEDFVFLRLSDFLDIVNDEKIILKKHLTN